MAYYLLIGLLTPEPYLSYFRDGFSLGTLIWSMIQALPFILMAITAYWRCRRRELPAVLYVVFLVLAGVLLFQLDTIWRDQFNSSRGFGGILAIQTYLFISIPATFIGLILLFLGNTEQGAAPNP